MSDVNMGQGGTDGTAPSPTPPGVSGGSNQLPPGQPLPRRTVRGVASETFVPSENEIFPESSRTGMAGPVGPQGEVSSVFGYTGQNLVDSNGIIVRRQYAVGGDSDEAYAELAKMDARTRQGFLNSLYNVGIYGRSKPSVTGLASRDLSAIRQAMMYANTKGVTLDVAQTLLAGEVRGRGGLGGARVRTTPKQDLREVYKQVSLSTIGRAPTDAETEKFVRAYQSQEVSEAYGGATAPSVQVAAQQQVEIRNPEESAAMGALQLASLFDQAVKGLA